jgi:hypothetical protein
MDGRTDGRTDRVIPIYPPPPKLCLRGGMIRCIIIFSDGMWYILTVNPYKMLPINLIYTLLELVSINLIYTLLGLVSINLIYTLLGLVSINLIYTLLGLVSINLIYTLLGLVSINMIYTLLGMVPSFLLSLFNPLIVVRHLWFLGVFLFLFSLGEGEGVVFLFDVL